VWFAAGLALGRPRDRAKRDEDATVAAWASTLASTSATSITARRRVRSRRLGSALPPWPGWL